MEKIGYVGKCQGQKIFFNGDFYYAEIGGKNYAVDENKIEIERWKPGCQSSQLIC